MSKQPSPTLCLAAALLAILVLQALPALPGLGQEVLPEKTVPYRPPPPPDFEKERPRQSASKTPPFDSAKAHRDAEQLVALAQKIPTQIDQVSKNTLPKDLLQNLKQIEKLAKRLRSEIPE